MTRAWLLWVAMSATACADPGGESGPPHSCRGFGVVIEYADDNARDRAADAIHAAAPELACAQRYAWNGLFCLPVANPECGFDDAAQATPYQPVIADALASAGLGPPAVSAPQLDGCLCRDY